MPAWVWPLIGTAVLGAGGGLTYAFAESSRQTLEARLGQDLQWKQNVATVQALSVTSVSLFVAAGVSAGASLVVFLAQNNRKKARPKIRGTLKPSSASKSPPPLPQKGMTLWQSGK